MRRPYPRQSLIALLVGAVIFAVCPLHAQDKLPLSFDQIFKSGEPKVTTQLPTVSGWADDDHYLITKRNAGDERPRTYSVEVGTGKEQVYRDLSQYASLVEQGIDVASPAAHNDAYTRLIYTKGKDLFFLNTETREFKRLTQSPNEEKNPTVSPDGSFVAFTRDNNLFAIDLKTGKESQYTSDGNEVTYNGWASWVYYEEILGRPSRYRAFWWSPDGSKLAFYRFDDTHVPMFPLYNADGVHGTIEKTRYPEAGDPNPEVKVGIVPVTGGPVVWADFNEKDDQYFGVPFWTPDAKRLFVQWMNRGQDTLIIYGIDPQTGKKTEVYREHQASWVEWFDSITFLEENKGFIIQTDKDGWSHLYLHVMDGRLVNRITDGKWNVVKLLALDNKKGLVYFSAKKEASTRTDLYRATFNGKNIERLTFGAFTNTISISPRGENFITTYSNASTPSRMALCSGSGKVLKDLADSKAEAFGKYMLAKSEMITIRTADGVDLPALWTLPLNFDGRRRYPVLIEIYGGPNGGTVVDRWQGIGGQWLAKEGVIQLAVDHRGSGHFGKEGVALMYRNLGKWEMHDYIEAVKWLRKQPFVDSTKICITGGSYGGYVTCLALTEGADYFTHGLALYSVTDWRLYDSHYVERFMDTPAENPEGYANSSVLTYASKLKGVLRIVHGTMDDNVHMQNVLQLIDKLEDANKHFEFMLYPGGRHGWVGPKALQLQNESYRFYYRYLLEKAFPEDLFNSITMENRPRGMRR